MSGGPETGPGGLPERELRAAEYVLGTLPAPERAALALERTVDPATDALVAAWERRLAPLALAAPDAAPPDGAWEAIRRALPHRDPAALAGVAILRGQVRRWRLAAAGATALAAGLALFIAAGSSRPEPGPRYLAVVQAEGTQPALVVSVDLAAGTAQVRPVGAQAPAGKSLELWFVGAGAGAAPKPLGVVGATPTRLSLPQGASAEGVLAVSVEPPGGSPTGQPTGPVIYTGKLIRE